MRNASPLVFAVLLLSLPALADEIPAVTQQQQEQYEDMMDINADDPLFYTERWRPQLAFSPILGYLNDPNGLSYFNGKWHLMYQHWKVPFIKGCGWGHAVSDDLLHWQQRPPVMTADEKGDIWSGSAVVDKNNASGFFAKGKAGLVAFFTYRAPDGYQSVGVAHSPDGETWTKYAKNPVLGPIRGQPNEPDQKGFRDPKVFWHAPTKRWVMVLGADKFRIYSSANLKDWRLESVEPFVTECPDLFELPVQGGAPGETRWVLSLAGASYRLGSFDGKRFAPQTGDLPLSYRSCLYAGQTFDNAPQNRRVFIQWYNRYDEKMGTRWSCALSLPVELSLSKDAEGAIYLAQTPVEELKKLRASTRAWNDIVLKNARKNLEVSALPAEIEAVFSSQGAKTAGLNVRVGRNGERTRIGYNFEKQELFIARGHSESLRKADLPDFYTAPLPLEAGGTVRVRVFVDESMVDVFGGDGRVRLASWIFPEPASDGVELFAEGGEADFKQVQFHALASLWRPYPADGASAKKILLPAALIKTPVGKPLTLSAVLWPRNAAQDNMQWSSAPVVGQALRALADNTAVLTPAKAGEFLIKAQCGDLKETVRVIAYEPTFRSNVARWAADNEVAWGEINGGLRGKAEGGKRTYYNAPAASKLQNGTLEADILLGKGARAGFAFRDNGRHKVCYQLWLDGETGQAELVRMPDWDKQEILAQADLPADLSEPMAVEVAVSNETVAVSLDGKPVLSAPNTGMPKDAQRFSLAVQRGAAVFQNVNATAAASGH